MPAQILRKDFEPKLDELKAYFSNSIVHDDEFELAYFTALSFYPEFENVSIDIQFASIKTSMQCRPYLNSFFGSKRRYLINVNNDKDDPVYPIDAGFSALVGCFGHELAHILRYENQSKRQIMYDGIKFISSQAFRSQYEKETDILAAKQGLGYEQYEFAKYIFNHPDVSQEYLDFKRSTYHTPIELFEICEKYSCE
jgi:hypothetical protein